MTIKQWRYDDDADDETAAEYLLNTILGKVMDVLLSYAVTKQCNDMLSLWCCSPVQ